MKQLKPGGVVALQRCLLWRIVLQAVDECARCVLAIYDLMTLLFGTRYQVGLGVLFSGGCECAITGLVVRDDRGEYETPVRSAALAILPPDSMVWPQSQRTTSYIGDGKTAVVHETYRTCTAMRNL